MLLYAEADATDVTDVLLLLNQLMLRFKDALMPVMQVRGLLTEGCGHLSAGRAARALLAPHHAWPVPDWPACSTLLCRY